MDWEFNSNRLYDWEFNLTRVYVYVSDTYAETLWPYCQRFSNNSQLFFTDEEVIAIYLFGVTEGHFQVKKIYEHTKKYLWKFFPFLPSYTAFVMRLNRFDSLMPALVKQILHDFGYVFDTTGSVCRLIDSMPVIMADARRSSRAKVASEEIAEKGYCSSKGIWYYGVKIHILGIERKGTLPLPEYIGVTGAEAHDLPVFKQIAPLLSGKKVYADKAYADAMLKQELIENLNTDLMTPVKLKKGQEKHFLPDKLFSTAVCRVRQPIESLFSWLQEKTGIEIASKVRSFNGLMVHIFGKLAAALLMLAFNS